MSGHRHHPILRFETLGSRLLLCASNLDPNIQPIAEENCVLQIGNVVTVKASDADNTLQLDLGAETHRLTMDGEMHEFDASVVDRILIYAGDGSDTVTINGSAADERVESNSRSIEVLAANYIARVEMAEAIQIDTGEGTDRVEFVDSVGDDRIELRPDEARHVDEDGRVVRVTNHERAEAYATQGGIDSVSFYDSDQDDRFVAKYLRSFMVGDGFLNFARGFEHVDAYRELGGRDEARLYDSPVDDELTATATETRYKVEFATHTVHDFPLTRSYSSTGRDTAVVTGHHFITDFFVWEPHSAYMHTNGTYDPDTAAELFLDEEALTATNVMVGFVEMEAVGSDPSDRAELRGSPGNDSYVGLPEKVELVTPTSEVEASFFRVTRAFGRGGTDTAYLEDSAGDDEYIGNARFAYLEGETFLNYVSGFAIDAVSRNGGEDLAEVFEYSGPAKDYLVHSVDAFLIVGPDRDERVVGFAQAIGTGDMAGYVLLAALTNPFVLSGSHSQADQPSADLLEAITLRITAPLPAVSIVDGDIELGGSDLG